MTQTPQEKVTSRITRHRLRIRKLRRTEDLMRAAINSHRLLEPMQCDACFMGPDYLPKIEQYRSRHDRLLRSFAELTCERTTLQMTDEKIYAAKEQE